MLEIQGINEVGHVFPAPWYHLVGLDIFVSPGCEPLLDKQNLGIMVCSLSEDPVATSPWGDYVEWHAKT